MKRLTPLSLISLTAAGALALTGCSTDAPAASGSSEAKKIEVTDAHGTVEVPQNPEKVISMDLGVVDSLDALDEKVAGLPKSSAMPKELEQKYQDDSVINAGSLKEPDMEAIAEAKPDLIIISARTAKFADQFKEIAPTVDLTVDNKNPVDSFKKQAETLGEIFEKQDQVKDKLNGIDQQIQQTKDKAKDAGSTMFLMTSAGEVNAYGPHSRFGSILFDTLGFTPAGDVQAEGSHGEAISFEAIAQANPDRMYVLDRDAAVGSDKSGEAAKKVLDNQLVDKTTAAQKDQVTYVDPISWYLTGYGLNNFSAMLGEIQDSVK